MVLRPGSFGFRIQNLFRGRNPGPAGCYLEWMSFQRDAAKWSASFSTCAGTPSDKAKHAWHSRRLPSAISKNRLGPRWLVAFLNAPVSFSEIFFDSANNNAEGEIRSRGAQPAVLMRKTSYGNRSEQGKETQAALMSMVRACAKRGENFSQFASSYLGAP